MALRGLKKIKKGLDGPVAEAKPSALPVPSANGDLMLSIGGKKWMNDAVKSAFEMIGGVKAFSVWAADNPTDFYTKMASKTMVKEVEREEVRDSVESIIDAIDTDGKVIEAVDAEFEDV